MGTHPVWYRRLCRAASVGAVLLTLLLPACAVAPTVLPTSTAIATATSPSIPTPVKLPSATVAASPVPGDCAVDEPWTIELTISGGLAGIEHKLEVDSSGAYEAEDLQSGAKVDGTLPAATVAELEALLPPLCQEPAGSRPPSCADCFTYRLEVTAGDFVYQATMNDLSLPDSTAAPLVAALNQILSTTLGP